MINYFDLGLYKDALEMSNMNDDIIPKYGIPYHMYGFEANPEYADSAKKKFSKYKDISIHNIAISSEDKPLKLYLSSGKGDSIYDSKININKKKFITVPGMKFSSFVKENKIKLQGAINIVKINIEGAEWDFFNDIIDNDILKHITIFIGRGHDPHKIQKFIDDGTNIKYDNLLKSNNITIHRYCGEYPFHKNFNIDSFLRKEIIKRYYPNS